MKVSKTLLCSVLLLACFGSRVSAQQSPEAVPEGPFETVHLMKARPDQVSPLLAAIKDFNHEFAVEGCPSCAYRLFKMFVGSSGDYNYLITSDWPNRDVYLRIHNSKSFGAMNARNPIFGELSQTEFYGRYVEVK